MTIRSHELGRFFAGVVISHKKGKFHWKRCLKCGVHVSLPQRKRLEVFFLMPLDVPNVCRGPAQLQLLEGIKISSGRTTALTLGEVCRWRSDCIFGRVSLETDCPGFLMVPVIRWESLQQALTEING